LLGGQEAQMAGSAGPQGFCWAMNAFEELKILYFQNQKMKTDIFHEHAKKEPER